MNYSWTANVWFRQSPSLAGEGGIVREGGQEVVWHEFVWDPPQWWDNNPSQRHPHFRHKVSKHTLCLNNWCKPSWVELQLCMSDGQVDAGMRMPPESESTSGKRFSGRSGLHDGDLEVQTCRKLCEDGHVTEAVEALNLLVQRGYHVTNHLFYRVIKRCIADKDLGLGRRIHALTVESGYGGDPFLATHLISLYASHGRLEEAIRVFSTVKPPSAFNWASIISAHARHGEPAKALGLYRQMLESNVRPCSQVFVAVLKACTIMGNLAVGKDVHAHIRASAMKPNIFVQTCLVDMYAKCGSLENAQAVFDSLSEKDVVAWTAMIAGYAQQGMGQEALTVYSNMQQEGITLPSSVTFVCLLQACATVGVAALQQGKQLHTEIKERGLQADVVVGSSLVNMYAKCGTFEDAERVFGTLSQKNVVTWTAMITGYAQRGMGQKALSLYRSMQQEGIILPDTVTFVCLLQACASVGVAALQQGKQLHLQIEQRGLDADVALGTSLVDMYAKCGSLDNARRVFDGLPQKTVVTWNAMIAGYAQQGMAQEALSLSSRMQKDGLTSPNSVTFVCLLQACASVGEAALDQGKQVHAQIEEQGLSDDVAVGNSLISMYAKSGCLEDARKLFDRLPHRDVVTWTAMIAGYAQQGMGQEALSLYYSMRREGTSPPNSVTFLCLLQACASVAALPLGQQLHAQIKEQGLQSDVVVGNSLVNMYAKCGSLKDAHHVFDSLPERDIVSWGALITGYARQGDSEVVFDLVDRMSRESVWPNGITFLGVLTVCSHVGLVDKGRKYFEAMVTDYGITPTVEHYTCMMDLLGRAGHLDEALLVAKNMPVQSNAAVWLTLLGACRTWSNVQVGRQAFEFAVSLDEKASAAYVLMSNIYASAHMLEEAKEMQARRLKSGAWKQPGQSWWTDMDGVLHSFAVGDSAAPPNELGRTCSALLS